MTIWDAFFLDGEIVLFKACISIFKIIKREILDYNIEDINTRTIENLMMSMKKIELLHYYILLRKFEFNMAYIQKQRRIIGEKVKDAINLNNLHLCEKLNKISLRKISYDSRTSKKFTDCCLNWPICLFDNDFKYTILDYMVIKSNLYNKIIENYFFDYEKKDGKYKIEKEEIKVNYLNYLTEDEILIERRTHFCYTLKENVEILFETIPDTYMNNIFEDQEFEELDENKESLEKSKLQKRQGMKCNYLKLDQGGGILS